mmetsp:Transcript_7582/g.18134  ORF Transcript_7582/g.18134 Transcript_7582/m.18134 type:complete len:262 (-) Transcript_7582:568-1353(-)
MTHTLSYLEVAARGRVGDVVGVALEPRGVPFGHIASQLVDRRARLCAHLGAAPYAAKVDAMLSVRALAEGRSLAREVVRRGRARVVVVCHGVIVVGRRAEVTAALIEHGGRACEVGVRVDAETVEGVREEQAVLVRGRVVRVGLVVRHKGIQAVRGLVEVVEGRGAVRLVEDRRIRRRGHVAAARQNEAGLVNVVVTRIVGALNRHAVLDGEAHRGANVLLALVHGVVHAARSIGAGRVANHRDLVVGEHGVPHVTIGSVS